MENKKVIIIASIIGVILLAVISSLAIIKLLNAKVVVTFDSKGGETVESLKVKKGTEVTLPTVSREGYNFLGWYDESNKKVESKVTIKKATTFHAQWEEIPKENSFTVTFDSTGGSAVNNLVVECGKELTLPTAPTRDGYNFLQWNDQNEKPILDKALLACEDITLYAQWQKIETPKKEETKKETTKKEETKPVEKPKVYTCPSGYTLEGTKCTIEGTVHETCPSDTKIDGTLCIRTSDSNGGERVCKEDTVSIDGKGHTWTGKGDYYFFGNSYGKCAYYKWDSYTTQSQCSQANDIYHRTTWISELNGCYAESKMGNYETVCSSDYQWYTSQELSSKFGIHDNGKCLRKVVKTKYCDEGYALTSGKCIKTIDATLQ